MRDLTGVDGSCIKLLVEQFQGTNISYHRYAEMI